MKKKLVSYAKKVWKSRLAVGVITCGMSAAILAGSGLGAGTVIAGAMLSGVCAAALMMSIGFGVSKVTGLDI